MLPQRILVGTDFSGTSLAALDWAIDLARGLRVPLTVVHVFDLPIVGLPDASLLVDAATASRLTTEAQTALNAEVARVRDRGVPVDGSLRQGDPRAMLGAVSPGDPPALLVVGSHGRRGLARALLGSVAEAIVRHSEIPVLVVRAQPTRG